MRPLRLLAFTVATVATGIALWYALLGLGIYVFDASTPECTDSDTCSAWGDFLYHVWPGLIVCFLLAAVIWWLLIRPVRISSRDRDHRGTIGQSHL